jgi:hypothetical protein
MTSAEQHADRLLDRARDDHDIEAAALLRKLGRVNQVAYEMVWARTHEQSKAAYVEMIDLIKGKAE